MEGNLFEYLDSILHEECFQKRGKKIWFRKTDSTILICEAQVSRYSNAFYLNFGIVFPELVNGNKMPKLSIDNWHVRGRFEEIIKDRKFIGSFPFEISTKDQVQLKDYLKENIKSCVVPFLLKYSSVEMVKREIAENVFDYGRMLTSNQV
ncbi:DUF4304 domain-containing protein [Pontibacter qinzhouensis]|nr:DUF4304 domain-containing protein [Pontibacter qinzhouensis]